MTKNLITVVIGMILLGGCQKVDLSEYLPEKESGYAVTFKLSDYSITDFDDSKKTEAESKGTRKAMRPARELGSVINIAVFKDGVKIKTMNQKSTDSSFGTVKMLLPEGSYRIVALVHSCAGNATITSAEKISFPNNKLTDTFSCSKNITVSGNADIDLMLNRCVAKFRMTITDNIPSDVAALQFYYTGGSSTLNAVSGFGSVKSRQTEKREVKNHSDGQTFEVYTFPHAQEGVLDMTVTALDAMGGAYAVKTLAKVPVEMQKVTNCRIPFFGNNATSHDASFSISGDDAWKGEIEYQ